MKKVGDKECPYLEWQTKYQKYNKKVDGLTIWSTMGLIQHRDKLPYEGAPPAGTPRAGQPITIEIPNKTIRPRGRPCGHCPRWGHPLYAPLQDGTKKQNKTKQNKTKLL
jgi:hypothetical protein